MRGLLRRSSVKLSFVLMAVAFLASLTHLFSSTRYVLNSGPETGETAEAITRTYSAVIEKPHKERSHQVFHSALTRRVNATPGTFIHSKAPFAPQLHESFAFATEECRCPQEPDQSDLFSSLNILARQHEAEMPMPTRIAPPPVSSQSTPAAPGEPRKTQMVDLFSEVFVINLPDRRDRRHYMCTIMQRIGSDALFWPGFSKYSPIVSAYYTDRRYATPDAITGYLPPAPPPPTAAELAAPEYIATDSKQDTQQQPPPNQIEGDSELGGLASAVGAASNISWGDHAPPRPDKTKMFTRSQAACYVTHREVWHNIVHRQLHRPSLILEDDVDIELGFPEILDSAMHGIPDDWAVVFVGHCFEEKFSHEDVRITHRVYRAIKPACTHSYVIRNATVAELLLDEMGHDLVKPIDLGLISLIEAKGEQIPMYVMLPPPVTQLWRTRKRKTWKGGDVANPSDVVVQGLKLPLQRIVTPVKDVVLAEAAAALAANPDLTTDVSANASIPLPPPLDWGDVTAQVAGGGYLFKGDATGLLCNNPLFSLQPPEDAPEELVKYPDSEYLP